MLKGCVKVDSTEDDTETDISGVDYWATLRGGAVVGIDSKSRTAGCGEFWKHDEPELALEKWSQTGRFGHAQVGWTLDESKQTDYTLHTFDPADSDQAYLLPFQLLRIAFKRNCRGWFRGFFHAKQVSTRNGNTWESECVFVPVSVVLDAITDTMKDTAA